TLTGIHRRAGPTNPEQGTSLSRNQADDSTGPLREDPRIVGLRQLQHDVVHAGAVAAAVLLRDELRTDRGSGSPESLASLAQPPLLARLQLPCLGPVGGVGHEPHGLSLTGLNLASDPFLRHFPRNAVLLFLLDGVEACLIRDQVDDAIAVAQAPGQVEK